jgi:hypothetical protein
MAPSKRESLGEDTCWLDLSREILKEVDRERDNREVRILSFLPQANKD